MTYGVVLDGPILAHYPAANPCRVPADNDDSYRYDLYIVIWAGYDD